jgi:hypothetical protein
MIAAMLFTRAAAGVAGAALLLAPLACSSGDDDDGGLGADAPTAADDDTPAAPPSGADDEGATEGAGLPDDPCGILEAAVGSLGWTVTETELVDGPGGPGSECNWEGTDTSTSFRNGWVMFIPSEQIDLEYHEDEVIDGVGAEAFRGSPQSGEILVTGADPPFRLWLTGGADEDADAVALASATRDAS